MIGWLSGKIAQIDANIVIVDVGGVGYRVSVPVSALTEIGAIGAKVILHIHTVVREDEISLYGFPTSDQLKAFEILISVTGIGPKVALAILSTMDVATLAHAITTGDTRTLIKVPGLGQKTAQRIALELSDKIMLLSRAKHNATDSKTVEKLNIEQFEQDIANALVGLGYNRNESKRAVEKVVRETVPTELSSAKALRDALNVLTGNRQ